MTAKQEMRKLLLGRMPKNQPPPPARSTFVCCPAGVVLPTSLPFAQAIYQWAYTNAVLQTETAAPSPAHFDPDWN